MERFELHPIGFVESALVNRADAPRQGDEGAPTAWLRFGAAVGDGLRSLRPGDDILVLTWLHLARRDVLVVHPRSDPTRPREGVFSTRSPDRPNPIGIHRAKILEIDSNRIRVDAIEAINRTPIIDVKAVLDEHDR